MRIKSLLCKAFGISILLSILYFTWLMILITWQYIPVDYAAAFLNLKDYEMQFLYYRIAFFTHVYTSICILVLGFIQFSSFLRRQHPKIHRTIGKAYVALILIFAAPSGLIMGIHGNGGIYSQISFVIQAILWFYFTLAALIAIKKQHIQKHQNFMILSFAMTLSAISLRLFKWMIVHAFTLPPMDTYKIVVWLGWITNIFIASIIIHSNNRKTIKNELKN